MDTLGEQLLAMVPFARTVGLTVTDVGPSGAVVHLPATGQNLNHVGGPHAGAMFTAGETASGAVVLAAFGGTLSRATPLAVHAEIDYTAFAQSDVTATATLDADPTEVIATLDRGERPEFDVAVDMTCEGMPVARLVVRWTLRPVRG